MITQGSLLFEILRWLAVFLYLAIVFSPFLIIRHERFQPTRWWHILGAYIGSILVFAGTLFFLVTMVPTNSSLYIIIEAITIPAVPMTVLFLWPLSLIYSTKMLYGHFTKRRLILSVILSIVLFIILFFLLSTVYWILLSGALLENI